MAIGNSPPFSGFQWSFSGASAGLNVLGVLVDAAKAPMRVSPQDLSPREPKALRLLEARTFQISHPSEGSIFEPACLRTQCEWRWRRFCKSQGAGGAVSMGRAVWSKRVKRAESRIDGAVWLVEENLEFTSALSRSSARNLRCCLRASESADYSMARSGGFEH